MSNLPWIEKYRPKLLDDIVSHENIISLFKSTLQTGNLPHLLMYGNPGSGKCLRGDTVVLLYSGEVKKVSDITINDVLLGDDNMPRYIYNLASGIDDMYKVTLSNGDYYVVNSEHILSLDDNETIVDICIKDVTKYPHLKSYKVGPIKCWNKLPKHTITEYIDMYNNDIDISEVCYFSYDFRCDFIEAISINNVINVTNNKDAIIFIINSLGYSYEIFDKNMKVIKKRVLHEFEISYVGKDKYYGFQISGNGRFVLGNFVVTHNTSTIMALARELFGPNKLSDRVIELNASDERGINIVRDKLVTFAKLAVGNPDPMYKCPPYKIIILDEADAMTTEAQSALRKIIEDKSHVTIFCFICNYINQIIDPIASRCVKLHFKPIEKKHIYNKLVSIANNENLSINDEAIHFISDIATGDMRKAIMLLQNLKYLNKYINIEDACYLANIMPFSKIELLVSKCIHDKTIETTIYCAQQIFLSGYPIDNIIRQIAQIIMRNREIKDLTKVKICCLIADKERLLIDNADEYLQILDLFQKISTAKN